MIRLRQVALVANDLAGAVAALQRQLGLTVCFRDPGVAEFGLVNALMVIGDQFLEVVSPRQADTSAGRLLAKRGGDGGYMAIFEVDDLDARIAGVTERGTRVVWAADLSDIRGRHLHPSDVGGAIVSLDQPTPQGSWRWGGPTWRETAHSPTAAVTAIAGVAIGCADPQRTRARWTELGLAQSVDFVPSGPRGEGLDGVDVVAADRGRAGERHEIGGVAFRFV